MRLYSWNVNGIRSAINKGLLSWLEAEQPDVLCLQETKARRANLLDSALSPGGYTSYWAEAERRGYSGVATYCRTEAKSWRAGLDLERFDCEGRVVVTEVGGFELYNIYFPNGKANSERLAHKLDFYAAFLEHVDRRAASGCPVIFCGDVNTSHRPIDIARPKENETISGFLPEERACLDCWVEHGWIDSFRHFHPDTPDAYSWWSLRTGARARNIGWRLDYFFVHGALLPRMAGAGICPDVAGADHCPVWLELKD